MGYISLVFHSSRLVFYAYSISKMSTAIFSRTQVCLYRRLRRPSQISCCYTIARTFKTQVFLFDDEIVIEVVHHTVGVALAVQRPQSGWRVDCDQLEDVVGLFQNLRCDVFLAPHCKCYGGREEKSGGNWEFLCLGLRTEN